MSSDNSESISCDELADTDNDTENNPSNSFSLQTTKIVLSDHRQFVHTSYERLYKWLYIRHLKNDFMLEICTVFCGDNPCSEHTSRRAWSHKGVAFKENPCRKLCQQGK